LIIQKRLKEHNLIRFAWIGGDQLSIVSELNNLNMMQVPNWHVQEGTNLEELIALAEKAKNSKGLGVYQFHGIGGPLFMISSETHKALLKYLKDNARYFLVTTFTDAKEIIEKRNKAKVIKR
jgi:hypothetical protein